MKYFSVLIITFVFLSTPVLASQEVGIFDDIADIDITSGNSNMFEGLSDSVTENESAIMETEIYIDYEGMVFGLIQKDRFGIVFDNDESLVVSLETIDNKTVSEIKNIITSDQERYSERVCVSKYGACEYTKEGYTAVKEEKTGFFKNIKTFFYRTFSFLFSVFTTEKDDSNSVEAYEELGDEEKEKLTGDTWIDFFDYRENKGKEGYGEKKSLEIKNNIFKLIANSDSLKEIMDLRALIDQYCYEENKGGTDYSEKCEKMRSKLKEKGDELKEKLFAEIDEGDEDGLRKLIQLRAVLMAQEKASKGTPYEESETDTWFSSENVAKINKGIREKAKKWWKEHLEKEDSVEDLWKWRSLALAYENASMEYKNTDSVFGEHAGKLMGDVKKQVAGIIAANLFDLDICNPDLKKLKKVMNDLVYGDDKSEPAFKESCSLLLSESACEALKKKDLQKAYFILFYGAGFGEHNPKPLPAPPIKCQKDVSISSEEKDDEVLIDTSHGMDVEIDIKDKERDRPENSCTLTIFEDEVIGWDYNVENCTRGHDEGLVCWERCGAMPPLVIKDIKINECYETAEGYINKDLTVSCHYRPMPTEGIEDCIKGCLME